MGKREVLIALGIVAVQAFVMYLYGQPAICDCGYVKAWEGVVLSLGNSQHLADWYTFSHIIHGFLFYALLWWLFPRMSVTVRFLYALGIEAAWELAENTPMVIDHYREQALASGYIGDSIINSLSDTFTMALGFLLARRLPVAIIVGSAIGLELFVAYSIRDNLTLNVLNFVHQFPAIEAWQARL